MPPTANPSDKKIFGSYSGVDDLPRMQQILERLRDRGYATYLDREGNRLGDPVTAKIAAALRTSTICLVYYSKRYARRHACQFELLQALSADRRAGGVARTLVINPEKSKDHIHPVRLRDQIYLHDDRSDEALDLIVTEVIARLGQLTGSYEGIDFESLPHVEHLRRDGRPRVRRYGAMWQLESALHAQDFPMTQKPTNGVAVLTGLTGSGKTVLADDYWLHFKHEYEVIARVDLADEAARTELPGVLAGVDRRLGSPTGRALVIVDNVPAGVPEEVFTSGFDSSRVLLLLVTEHTEYAALGTEVRLGGLTEDEAVTLFRRLHEVEEDDATIEQVRQLVVSVDCHPAAVWLIATSASVKESLTSLTEHVGRVLDGSSDLSAALSSLFEDRLRAHGDGYQRAVLQFVTACGPAPVPVRQIVHVLAGLGLDDTRVVAALQALRVGMVMGVEKGVWHADGLIKQAVRTHLDGSAVDLLASLYADRLVTVLSAGSKTHDPDEWKLMVRHARHLVDQPAIAAPAVNALLPLIARALREEGRPALAARVLQRLFAAGVSDPALVVNAAFDHYDAGEYEEAERLADQPGSPRTRALLSCVRAAALDALGQSDQAEQHWQRAVEPADFGVLTREEQVKVRLRWIRGRRMRGVLKENVPELESVVAAEQSLPVELVLLALIELAHIEMLTDEQGKARRHARRVLDHYRDKGQPRHAAALEAEYVLATAQLRLQFTELKASPVRWAEAEKTLRRLARELEDELGARNVDVLGCKVNVDFALISRGEAKAARKSASELLPVLRGRLGEHHPLVLRERYVLGLAHFQLAEFGEAAASLERAHRGQLTTLGIAHPETLQTQFEFAMALKLGSGDQRKRANDLLDEVVKHAKAIVGLLNDLPWQAFTAATLARYAPRCALRAAHRANHKHKW